MRWLELTRFAYTPFGTFGTLSVWEGDGTEPRGAEVFACYTVEPRWLDNATGRSCVPVGKYPLLFEWSPRFKRELWELKSVPGRSESKIHPANLASQLEGCIAPGLRLGAMNDVWSVQASAVALEKIHEALKGQKATYLVIRNAPEQGVLEAAA